jgi:acetolactate synthase I/II/III large subunit
VAEFLSRHVKHVFCISGGASLHLIHSIAARDDIKFICPQHEQSAGFMADAYARLTGFGVAIATSGPGASNFATPIRAAWNDSIPVLFITGNQTRERMKDYGTRGYGFQASKVVESYKHELKYASVVDDEGAILAELMTAVTIAKGGRPGPVLLDIPDDVQRAQCVTLQ